MNLGRNWSYYIWSIAIQDFENRALRKLESFELWCWRRTEKIQWPEKVSNEAVLDCMREEGISKQYPA